MRDCPPARRRHLPGHAGARAPPVTPIHPSPPMPPLYSRRRRQRPQPHGHHGLPPTRLRVRGGREVHLAPILQGPRVRPAPAMPRLANRASQRRPGAVRAVDRASATLFLTSLSRCCPIGAPLRSRMRPTSAPRLRRAKVPSHPLCVCPLACVSCLYSYMLGFMLGRPLLCSGGLSDGARPPMSRPCARLLVRDSARCRGA